MKKNKVMIFTKVTSVILLLAVVIISSIGCGSSNKEGNSKYKYGKLQIQALDGSACGSTCYIAYEKGFFKEEGLDVELVSGDLDNNKTGFATGKFIVTNGDFQWFLSIEQGMDLKVIGGLHEGCIKIVVPPNSDIKSVKDLKGKRIGVDAIGGTPMAVTTVALSNEGIDSQKDVSWKAYPLDQLTSAVSKGEIDAFAAWDPYGTLANENDNYTILLDIGKDKPFIDRSCCFLYASGTEVKKNPDKVKAIARAYKKACKWIRENPEETAKIDIDKGYVSGADEKLLTELLKSYNFEYRTDKAKDDLKYFAKNLSKTGFISKKTNAGKFTKNVYYDVFNGDDK